MMYSSDDIKSIILKARCVVSAFINDDVCLADNQVLYISISQLKKALELNIDIQDSDEYQEMVSVLSAKLEAFAYLFDDITIDDSYYSIKGEWVFRNLINDNIVSSDTTWSSYKIKQEFDNLPIQPTGSNLKGEWNQEDADAGEYDKYIFVSHNGKIWKSLVDNNIVEPSSSAPAFWEQQSNEDFAESILTEDITSTVTEGNINAGETLPIGMTFTGFVKKFLQKIFYPTFIEPSLSIVNNIGTREIGSTVNQSILVNYNRGLIMGSAWSGVWDPDEMQGFWSGAASLFKAEWNGGSSEPGSNVLPINKVVESGNNTITVTVGYEQGTQPIDSTGADYGSPKPAGTIATTTGFTGAYYNFYGIGTLATDSASVRALSGKVFTKTFSLIFAPGQTKASFAYPATISDITNSSVKYVEGFNSDVGDTFTKSTFNVNDAGGNPVPYKIYTVEFPAPADAQITYNVTLP